MQILPNFSSRRGKNNLWCARGPSVMSYPLPGPRSTSQSHNTTCWNRSIRLIKSNSWLHIEPSKNKTKCSTEPGNGHQKTAPHYPNFCTLYLPHSLSVGVRCTDPSMQRVCTWTSMQALHKFFSTRAGFALRTFFSSHPPWLCLPKSHTFSFKKVHHCTQVHST